MRVGDQRNLHKKSAPHSERYRAGNRTTELISYPYARYYEYGKFYEKRVSHIHR
jgi:hypothetical protein